MTEAFYAILKASFQGSIVILAVMALRLLLKKAPKSLFCLLWLLAGLRLVLPFEIQSSLSLQPRLEDTNLSIQAEPPVQVPDILVQNPEGQPLDVPAQTPAQTPSLPEGNWENIQTEDLLYGAQDGTVSEPIRYGDIAAGVWVLGLVAMLAASAVSYFRLKRRVREAYLIENGCFECAGLDTAFVLGFFPPKIYLPMGLNDREKKFIFDHENTHIARHDHWFKLLGYAVLALHWFNPLAWLAYHLLCRDIELACDEHVVKYMSLPERKAYSAALLSCGSHTARIAACPVAFGESNPRRRIMNVLNYKRPSFWICLLAVIAVIFVSVCLLTSPDQGDDPTETIKLPAPENAAELEEQVREVLTEYANRDVVNFESISEFKVNDFLDTWVFRQDGNWVQVESDSGGEEWEAVLDGEGLLAMQGSQEPAQCSHWLLSTDWTHADFDILWCSEDGKIIECMVLQPFTVGDETAPDYWLQLNLDHNGHLETLTQRVCVDAEHNGKPVSRQLREEKIFIQSGTDRIEYMGMEHREDSDCHIYAIHAPDSIGGFYLFVELSQGFTSIGRTEDISQYTLCNGNGCFNDAHAYHDRTVVTNAIAWLEKCRTALEEYQSQGTWAIKAENSFQGEGALNSSSASLWYGCGNDYLKWAKIPDDGGAAVWWDLQVDGTSYHCNGYFFEDGTENWKSQWEEGSTNGQPVSPPWPLWYDWVGENIQFMEQGTENSMDYVTFTVQGSPFPEHPDHIGEYQVTFWFRGDFLHIIELSYQRSDSLGGGTRRYDLYAFAPTDGVIKISQCYEEALLHVHGICNDPECTNTEHDHYGISCTVEHCTNPAHGHGDEHHSDEHHD